MGDANKPGFREITEHELQNVGAGNLVEFVRNVLGPEPWREQPLSTRVFAIVCLGAPLVAILWVEWLFLGMIPAWLSLPLTAVTFIGFLWRYLRRTPESNHASRPAAPAASTSAAAEPADAREARRLARFLVSAMKLNNAGLVTQGVRDGSLYPLLKEEIEQARSLYVSNVPLATREAHDYLQDELVRILAGGNADLLKR